jgi:cytoskeletal protein RodZ
VSNRADLIIGLFVVVLIILGLGVYALFSQDGRRAAAPSVTPSAEEVTSAAPSPTLSPVPASPTEKASPTPGRPSPETASPTRGALATPSPVPGAGKTASPAVSPAASPAASPARSPVRATPTIVAAQSPSPSPAAGVAGGVAKTGSGHWWLIGLIPIALSLLLMRSLRQQS